MSQVPRSIRSLRRTTLYRGKIIHLIREVLKIHGKRVVRETILHPGSVVIVPLINRSRIVFVRQYRHAIGRVILELPAGTLNPGEDPRVCARRELEEETGWRAKRVRRIGQFYPAPGVFSEQMTVFLAEGLTPVKAHPEPDELLEPVIMPIRTVLAKIRSGTICDAKSIIGVLFAFERLA